jgi:hypothetical protein
MPSDLTADPSAKQSAKSGRSGTVLPDEREQQVAPSPNVLPTVALSPSPVGPPLPVRSLETFPTTRTGTGPRTGRSNLPPPLEQQNISQIGYSARDDNLFSPLVDDEDNLFHSRHRAASSNQKAVYGELPQASRVPARYRRNRKKQQHLLVPAIPLGVKLLLLAMRIAGLAPSRRRLKMN